MSWFDKVGDVYNWAKQTGIPAIGAAASGLHNFFYDTPVLGDISRDLDPVQHSVENALGQIGNVTGAVFSNVVARPVSTFEEVTAKATDIDPSQPMAKVNYLTNLANWRNAYNDSSKISAGQSLVIGSGLAPKGVTYDMTPDAMTAREEFFHNTWPGQVSSGTMDMALNLFADPTIIGGKAVKAAAVARNTFRSADEVSKVLKINEGVADAASHRESHLADRMNRFFADLDGKTSAEIALHPVVKKADQTGVFAPMFAQINQQIPDLLERRMAQRNTFGAMLGNPDSIRALKDQHALLANNLQRLSDTPVVSQAAGNFVWDDHGQGMFDLANTVEAPEIAAQRNIIERELARLEAATSSTGVTSRLAGSLKEQYAYTKQLTAIRQSTLNTGLGNMPVRVIGGALANRLPGHVAIKDPVSGFDDLHAALSRVRYLTGTQKRRLLDAYVNAADDGARQDAVHQAEAFIFHSTAKHYGLTMEMAQKLAEAGKGRRAAILAGLSSRLYSAAPDAKFVSVVNPEDGEIIAYSRPILQSQIEDHLPIIDPTELDKAMKEATANRLFERIAGQLGNATVDPTGAASRSFASSAYNVAGSAQMVASDALTTFTRLWKDSALMRLAYPVRIQVDSQMRLMTHMGVMAYLGTGLPKALKAQATYALSKEGGEKLSLANIFKVGDYEKALTGVMRDAGVHADDIPNIIRSLAQTGGGISDLAGEMSNAQLARYRANGEWGYVGQSNPGWQAAWTRAVNRQIRNSPTAMAAVAGATTDELKQLVKTSAAARKEWLNLRRSNGDDLDDWLSRVQAHVDHYLPDAEMRQAVLDGEVKSADVKKWFSNVDDRMQVHGESYSPTNKRPLAEWYENTRNRWYQFASEAPETVMARAPLYSHAFTRNLKQIVERHGLDSSDYKAIDSGLMTQYRKTADRMSRREVGRILFDASHSSNLSRSMRYVAPFFAAWEDMVKKWGTLFYDKPWAPVRFDQAWHAPNQAGFVVDENGNRVDADGNHFDPNTGRQLDPVKDKFLIGKRQLVTVPAYILPKSLKDSLGVGEMDPATGKKRPASVFSIDKNSFNIVFQGQPWWLPGAGPIVQVPVNQIIKSEFPEAATNPIIAWALPQGVSDNTVQDQFVPSWLRQVHNAFGGTQDHANIQAMLLAQETERARNGERGPIRPGEIADMTRNWFILRAITANASPVSMAPTPKGQFYVDQAHIYRQKYGQNWQEQFYKDFPQWYDLSLSLSNNETGIVATLDGINAAKKYRAIIADNPEYGWAAVGPDNVYGQTPGSAFNQAAYAWEQQAIGYGQETPFRGKSSPQDALAKVEASKGWMQYQSAMTKLNLTLDSRGLHSFTQKGAEDLQAAKKQMENYLASTNKSWRKDFQATDSGTVVNFLDWAQTAMSKDRSLASRPDMIAIKRYVELRGAIQKVLANRSSHALDNAGNADVKRVWDAANQYLVKDNIGFEQAWNRVLQHDDPGKQLLGMEGSQ